MQYIFTFLNTYIKGVLVNMLMFKLFFNADFQVVVLPCPELSPNPLTLPAWRILLR